MWHEQHFTLTYPVEGSRAHKQQPQKYLSGTLYIAALSSS